MASKWNLAEISMPSAHSYKVDRPTKTNNIKIDLDRTIQELENEASHKYLGVEEGHQICHKNVRNNYQRIPAQNETDPENIPRPKEQNQSHKPTSSTGVPIQLRNSKLATSGNQKTKYQNKETPHYPQNVLQKSRHPKNVQATGIAILNTPVFRKKNRYQKNPGISPRNPRKICTIFKYRT